MSVSLFIYLFMSDKIQVVESKDQQTYESGSDSNQCTGPYTHNPASYMAYITFVGSGKSVQKTREIGHAAFPISACSTPILIYKLRFRSSFWLSPNSGKYCVLLL